jgi:superfamily II DNA or RNA helicase/diadenosine tetraphosphate (Ap4A) HIT family hydrolase
LKLAPATLGLVTSFLDVPIEAWVASNGHAFAFRDAHPVSDGHTLVVTRRVVGDWFAATEEERRAIVELIDLVKRQLDGELHPDGYNVGFNAGVAAGQTVMHLHVHVIPRYRGDMDDPRGGVRHVIPSKGNYLVRREPLSTGGERDPFARHVLPLFERADDIAIVAAFVKESGVQRIEPALAAALQRGARVRIVTGNYLELTQASALEMLFDHQNAEEHAGRLETRVVVVEDPPLRGQSFHPKSWRFEGPSFGVAFVGSSNLSRAALGSAVEWNLRVDRDHDPLAFERARAAFEELWSFARPLDADWLAAYAEKAATAERLHAQHSGEVDDEPLIPAPDPHEVQREALEALRAARESGAGRGLVVLATGLGKTWLAAFDWWQLHEDLGRRPRVLFVAHREELLTQAARTFRRMLRARGERARVTWCAGERGDLSGSEVFASVAKLSRDDRLEALRSEPFDYVVIDEVHHAAAASYRKILDALRPRFLLGLTATPDRADARDILALFDDRVVYRADVARGVHEGMLAPFRYFGVKDDIDYTNIPWRNRRFDPDELARAVQTEARMQALWRAWKQHAGTRTIVFCCSIAHARFVRDWLRERGVRVNAVYSGEGSDGREVSLAALAKGQLDAVCAVDVFNEGVDVPSIDRVVMLRPTESSVVFLQQLGRGLRASHGKTAVIVVDFVGNHRVFLDRVRTLLSLGGVPADGLGSFLAGNDGTELPDGCSVDLELEAKEVLEKLFRSGGADEVESAYRELRDAAGGERPTAGQLQRLGYLPSKIRGRHRSWFEFLRSEGDLTDEERRVLGAAGAFLRELETTRMERCFKMVALEAMIASGQFPRGMRLRELAAAAHAILQRSPELFEDVAESERLDVLSPDKETRWQSYWRRNSIEPWTSPRRDRRPWFALEEDRFVATVPIDDDSIGALTSMTAELVDYRLAQYRTRPTSESFLCRVTWNQRDPILKLPSRTILALPEGDTDVRVDDGRVWQFRLMKEFCNVARPAGTRSNQLPDLLRRWFGPRAGQPGTSFEVRFRASPDGLWAEPLGKSANVVDLADRRAIAAYPDLRAAAGHPTGGAEVPDFERVLLPIGDWDPSLFAVRVSGTSMDGGDRPLRDGDWAVMRLARGSSASSLAGRVVLVQLPGESFGSQYQIKRLKQRDARWLLTSDNPEGPTFAATEDMVPIARLETVVRPEDLAPAVGTTLDADDLGRIFQIDGPPRSCRYGGHLVIVIEPGGMLEAPDRIRFATDRRRPSETAYVVAPRGEEGWIYLGVASYVEGEALWSLPSVDFATWRRFGTGSAVSRRLPEGTLERAAQVITLLLGLPEPDRAIEKNGRRVRVLGAAPRGGIRIGDGEMRERTISLTDLAWVIAADDDAGEAGGTLDEPRVNLLRYLEGTPKGSTRFIDTGWAIAAWNRVRRIGREV